MIQLKSRIPSPIHIHGKIGKAFPTFTVTFKDGDTVLQQVQVKQGRTATYNGTVPAKDGNAFFGWGTYYRSNPIVNPDDVTVYQEITNVQQDTICWAVYADKTIIQDSWEVISQRSRAGTASDYYNVGDRKKIHIEGTVGTLSVNQNVYVNILGFDHNSTLEGNGITFGFFKDTGRLKDCGLVDSTYRSNTTDGTKAFNMNHWGNANYGGWAGCDLRYDILGSTDVAPSGYGSIPDSSRIGYDATSTCATNPVANTLMSCFPADLRAAMKPMTKYTCNLSSESNTAAMVTATTDYLPLLSEFEVFGSRKNSNFYEQDKQEQYAYFAAGNSAAKYKYPYPPYDPSATCQWWQRSPSYSPGTTFCNAYPYGSPVSDNKYAVSETEYAFKSLGLAPIFLV